MDAALEAAQDRRVEEAGAREREEKLQTAEQEVEERRRAVEQANADARLRQQKTQQAAADQAERDRQVAETHKEKSEQETRMEALAAEKQALDARLAEQEQQRAKDEAEARQRQEQEKRADEERATREQADAAAKRQKKLDQIFVRHQAAISAMDFPPGYLDATVMLENYGGAYSKLATLRQWLALLMESGDFDIQSISAFNETRHGISMKRSGSPSTNVVFRKEGDELYMTAFGEGDKVSEATPAELQYVGAALQAQLVEIVQKATGTDQVASPSAHPAEP